MAGDEFHARYALLEQVAGEGARSFRATAPGGAEVMVHLVDGGVTPANLALLAALERLEPARRAQLREVTAVDGIIAVVTDPIPGFRSLPAWVQAAPSASATHPSDRQPTAASGSPADLAGTGEFTRLFRAMDPSAMAASSAPASNPAPPANPAPAARTPASAEPAVPSSSAPGDFTRLFRAGDVSELATSPAPPAPSDAAPSPSPSSAAASADPAPPASAAVPSASAKAVPPSSAPGDFTRLFRTGDVSEPATPPASSDPVPPPSPTSAAASADPAPPASAAVPSASAEAVPSSSVPGEYTRLFRAGDVSGVATAPASSSEPPAAPAPGSGGTSDVADATVPAPPPSIIGAAGDAVPAAPAPEPTAESGPPVSGASGVFAARPAQTPETAVPAQGGEGPGAYTRLFQRLELPEWAAQRHERPDAAGDAPSPELRLGSQAEPAADDGYLERLYTPSPEPAWPPAPEPRAEAAAPAGHRSDAPAPFSPPAASPPPTYAAPGAGPARSPSPASTQAAPGASRPNPLLVTGLAVVAVVAVLVIFLVLLR